ncbi:nucleoside triphosphate pyrophosphohydrolase [Clostridium sp. D2Q-11]|uniref:Nucleoside triphosphate pyrophosphohydrolase n=1 Tax=Anaeromonas frigoriresistens TaxID=2683708 RepID=A0A942UQZ2_9FIRM|nr:nucleoside triphosphate pyrophosphohydrolase [Anaeromonas frigoriresistens]MBS4537588.1 nucleoside triphosphate pyrophosphohydrolase [Anaeromonas frigoriresistens]
MAIINIIGLGFGDTNRMTLHSIESIKKYKNFFRTEKSPIIEYLKNNNIYYESYDSIYQDLESFEDVYEYIVNDLVQKSKEYSTINYCAPGSPTLSDKVTEILLDGKDKLGVQVRIIDNSGMLEAVYNVLGKSMKNGIKLVDSLDIKSTDIDINSDFIITQVYDQLIASEVKIYLEEIYTDEYPIKVINDFEDVGGIKSIPLYQLDRIKEYNHMTVVYIPCNETEKNIYDMNNLVDIMETLRSEKGCLWDIKQSHQSLREYAIEEAYEVVDAIDKDDMSLLEEELGDLLLQVVFHSQIAREEGYFNIWNVITSISKKLIYRHPHVFEDFQAKDIKQANENWDYMKNKSKNITSPTESMIDIPKGLPSLLKSYKVQKKASKVGFDWDNKEDAYKKVEEEIDELKEAIDNNKVDEIEEEFGDVLFALVNYGRFLNINPETALNNTINKFIQRFKYIEDSSKNIGKQMEEMSLKEMDLLWNRAKYLKNTKKDKNYS